MREKNCMKQSVRKKRILKRLYKKWTVAKLRLNHNDGVKGCSVEGHVSHVLSGSMTSSPMGWSIKGMSKMTKLREHSLFSDQEDSRLQRIYL